MKSLTEKQQVIFDFVCDFSGEYGFSPSLREIGRAVGLTNISAVRGHVAALEKKGYITKDPDKPRTISVVRSPSLMSRIKRRLHEFARTDEGVVHKVAYGIILATQGFSFFQHHESEKIVDDAMDRLCTEHGWKVKYRKMENDHVVLVVDVWPNHSPELAAGRIRTMIENCFRYHGLCKTDRLWTRGYAVTSDIEQLKFIEREFLRTCR